MSNRTTRTFSARTLALPVMPDRTISILSYTALALFATYLVFVIITVTLATWETSLALQVRETEGGISTLESTYYAALAKENATMPSSIGLVAPTDVEYATQKPAEALTFAGK